MRGATSRATKATEIAKNLFSLLEWFLANAVQDYTRTASRISVLAEAREERFAGSLG